METLSFAFGVLTMVGVALAVLIVFSVLKVIKLNKQIREHEDYIQVLEQSVRGRIDRVEEYIPKAINDQITDSVTQCNSYTDKRIDKLIDNYFVVKTGVTNKLINENKQK